MFWTDVEAVLVVQESPMSVLGRQYGSRNFSRLTSSFESPISEAAPLHLLRMKKIHFGPLLFLPYCIHSASTTVFANMVSAPSHWYLGMRSICCTCKATDDVDWCFVLIVAPILK